jgi:hypothetical protein
MTFMRVSVTSSPPRLRLPTWVARRLPLLREAARVAEEELGRRQDQLDVDLSRKRPDGHHVWARLQSSRAKFQAPLWLPDSPYVQRWRRRDQASQPYLAAFDFLAPAAIRWPGGVASVGCNDTLLWFRGEWQRGGGPRRVMFSLQGGANMGGDNGGRCSFPMYLQI